MRLIPLVLAALLAALPAGAQQPPASSSGTPSSTPQDPPALDLPVSLDRIRQAVAAPPAQLLRGLDEVPTFRVEIHEKQRIEELWSTMKFDSRPAPPGGLYAYEQQENMWSKQQHPEMQPYSAFSQGELVQMMLAGSLEMYAANRIAGAVRDTQHARAEQAARDEVQHALADFWAYWAAHPSGSDKP